MSGEANPRVRDGVRDVLAARTFTAFLAVFFADHVAEILWLVSFTWVASEPGGWKTGLILAAGAIPAVVFSLPGGAISDLFGSRSVAVYSMGARAVLFAAWAFVAATGDAPLLAVTVAAVCVGGISGVHDPAMSAYPRAILGPRGAESAAVAVRLAMRLAQGVGGYLGGALIALFWVGSPAAAGAILAVGCAFVLLRLRPPAQQRPAKEFTRGAAARRAWVSGIREGLTYVRHHRVLRWTIPTQFAVNLLCGAVLIAVLPLKARALGWSPTQYGIAFACYGIGMTLSTALVTTMRSWAGRRRVLTGMSCALATAILGVLLGLGSSYLLCTIVTGLIGLALGPVGTLLTGYAQAVAPGHLFGRVGSVITLATVGCEPLSWLFVGGFASWVGLTGASVALALLTLVVTGVCLFALVTRRADIPQDQFA